MVQLNILRDTREKKGWEFSDFDADVQPVTIKTGDYTLAEFCDHDKEKDTYYPNYAIERKGGRDFIKSITRDRDRFNREVKRASDWDSPLLVLIEEPKTMFKRQRGFMQYNEVTAPQVFGTVESWENHYNVSFRFVGTRKRGMQITFETLLSRLRSFLTSV